MHAVAVNDGANHLGFCNCDDAGELFDFIPTNPTNHCAGTPQHGLSSSTMAPITSERGATRFMSIKLP